MDNLQKISSIKFISSLAALLIVCFIIFQNLPNSIYENMLDLSFGFDAFSVERTFESLGALGRKQYVYAALILDTIFPCLYAFLLIAMLIRLDEARVLILCIPILAAVFDLFENIAISLMMTSPSLELITETQIFYGSLFNQLKWVFLTVTVVIIFFKLCIIFLSKVYK